MTVKNKNSGLIRSVGGFRCGECLMHRNRGGAVVRSVNGGKEAVILCVNCIRKAIRRGSK